MNGPTTSVQGHYGAADLLGRILAALEAGGKPADGLTCRDLAPVDQFHTRGLAATRELAGLAAPAPGTRVLDVGSGLGGPARLLAAEFGCDVTGIDLMPGFCAVATELSRRSGLAGQTRFEAGDALAMPFAAGRFEMVWTFQVQMNIADKTRFYGEIARVLRPGGRLAFQDILAGSGAPLDYPVPWASDASHSHLAEPAAVRSLLPALGLEERVWRDVSAETLAWLDAHRLDPDRPLPPLNMQLVMGEGFRAKRRNTDQALRDGRIVIVQGVFDKAA